MTDPKPVIVRKVHYWVEPSGQSGGICDCCGNETRTIWGLIHGQAGTIACYYIQWTVGVSLVEHPANFDLIIGPWGEGAQSRERSAVSALYSEMDGRPSIMVIDATDRPVARSALTGHALRRDEVIGAPLAKTAFALIDAIFLGEDRFVQG